MTPIDFRQLIKAELSRRKWTVYRLWRESGLPRVTVYRYMRGDSDLPADKLAVLLDALDIKLETK